MDTASMSSVDNAMAMFEQTAEQTRAIRWQSIEDVRSLWNTLKTVGNDAPRMIEVKCTLMNTLNGLLKDQESVAMQNVKLQLGRTDAQNNGAMAAQITELLRQVSVISPTPGHNSLSMPDQSEIHNKLNERFVEGNLDISEDELKECSGHPKAEIDLNDIGGDTKSDDDDD